MRYFKAFNPDMTCRGKQYEENTIYEEDGNAICGNGVMHFCETPFDCLDYYPIVGKDGRMPVFAEVEPLAKVLKEGNKCASRKLRIGAKLSLRDFINAQVDIQIEKGSEETAASGDYSQLAASGNVSKLAASGNGSQLAASGNGSQLAASGYGSQLAASGNVSKLAASGNGSQLAASGYGSQLAALGANSIAAAIGANSVASASLGSWIVLAEYEGIKPICVKAAQIDGEKLKPNVFYKLKGGEFVEVEE